VTQWALTLHIYLSMAGFLLLFLFAVTGLTLNHNDFGLSEPRLSTSTLPVPAAILDRPDEDHVTGFVRNQLGTRSPLTVYKEFPDEIELNFAAPGSRTHVRIDRADKVAHVEVETRGFWGAIGDLHKGRDSGRVWFWIIDVTAVLFMTSAITGIITLASLPSRRRLGFLSGAIGLVVSALLYLLWVPK
jgi:hypothetical protein